MRVRKAGRKSAAAFQRLVRLNGRGLHSSMRRFASLASLCLGSLLISCSPLAPTEAGQTPASPTKDWFLPRPASPAAAWSGASDAGVEDCRLDTTAPECVAKHIRMAQASFRLHGLGSDPSIEDLLAKGFLTVEPPHPSGRCWRRNDLNNYALADCNEGRP